MVASQMWVSNADAFLARPPQKFTIANTVEVIYRYGFLTDDASAYACAVTSRRARETFKWRDPFSSSPGYRFAENITAISWASLRFRTISTFGVSSTFLNILESGNLSVSNTKISVSAALKAVLESVHGLKNGIIDAYNERIYFAT
ncbi:hypothetical protein Y032_0151g2814 [Ancylostoma ceylanicum]|uniref:Uncharacterized protein n=1 Tax=Ancylostoma ceylanicum TaxID=53326 RepID=A0A016T0S3_9BILA|nr:hypothetical protein Y032_0151g2814 [Ancylostoma ceylanicum]